MKAAHLFCYLPTLVFLVFVELVNVSVLAQSANFSKPQSISTREGLPQGFVPGIVQDQRGFIWAATRGGLARYDGRHFKIFQPEQGRAATLSSLGLEDVQMDADGRIWVVTDVGAIDIFNPVTEIFFNFSKQDFYRKHVGKAYLRDIFVDSQDRVWLLSDKRGLMSIGVRSREINDYKGQPDGISGVIVRNFSEDKDGTIWATTRAGLFFLKKNEKDFLRYGVDNPACTAIDSTIYAIRQMPGGSFLFLAKRGIGTLNVATGQMRFFDLPLDTKWEYNRPIVFDSKGNAYFYRVDKLFRFSLPGALEMFPSDPEVQEYKSLFIDKSDVLWAGTNGQGLRKFNLRAGYFKVLRYQQNFVQDLFSHFLKVPATEMKTLWPDLFGYNFRYTFDRSRNLWFAAGQTPLYKLDAATKRISKVPFVIDVKDTRRSELPICLSTDPDGRIWALHDSVLVSYENGSWVKFPHRFRPGVEGGIVQLVADKDAFWLATGGYGLYRLDKKTGQLRRFINQSSDKRSLSSNQIYCLFADPLDEHLLWIGTFGGGLNRFDKLTGHSVRFDKTNGLPDNVVYAAIPDSLGNIWIATNQGLCQLNRRTFRTRTYTSEDGLMADEFNRFHSLALPGAEIFLGGIEGITAFDPRQSNEDTYQPPVFVTSISVNNTIVSPNISAGEKPVSLLEELNLGHWQNFLTIGFAAMQYNRSEKIRYRYQLTGVDKDWIETEQPETKYTDLRPGQYVLRLNASNTLGVWSPAIRTMTIHISPPWWQTWWAYLIYAAIAAVIVYGMVRTYLNRIRMQQSIIFKQKELDLRERETRRLKELDDMKTRFFSNITHEFRTPLTLILGPAEQMLSEVRAENDSKRLHFINRNARQLLGLINQLLDLSKIEAGNEKVNPALGDLTDFVERIVQTFQMTAASRDILLEFSAFEPKVSHWFDHDKIEKIVINLLSNAVKFTWDRGRIKVSLQKTSTGIELSVANTGEPIADDQKEKVFERFYQIAGQRTFQQGSGIGLSLVKELVEMQDGNVRVETHSGGFDTVFVVKLPLREGYSEPKSIGMINLAPQVLPVPDAEPVFTILLVEDHDELASFVLESLRGSYRVELARNGKEALEVAASLMPDLVISDVMMPVLGGYELCRVLKTGLDTSHIPVILLTAKSALESRVEGLQLGADDYITKPFHLAELRLRVKNLLERQALLYERLRKQFATPEPLVSEPDDQIDPFLEKLYMLLDANLQDNAFGVNEMVREIGMSNSSLNRKLKTLTDLSAVELIRNYRLKKAAELLSSGVPVSEAGYLVGFDNLSYFAKCFRDLFKMTPREFAAAGKERSY